MAGPGSSLLGIAKYLGRLGWAAIGNDGRAFKKGNVNVSVRPGRDGCWLFTDDRFLSSNEVMSLLGYKDRSSFWNLVCSQGIPHIRLNARVIKFPTAALQAWLEKRSNYVR